MSTAHDREKTEPTEEDKAIPLSMWVVAGILTAWGVGFYAVNAQQAITTTQTEPTLAANTQSGGAAFIDTVWGLHCKNRRPAKPIEEARPSGLLSRHLSLGLVYLLDASYKLRCRPRN